MLSGDIIRSVLAEYVVTPEFSGPVLREPSLGGVTLPWPTSFADSAYAPWTLVDTDLSDSLCDTSWFRSRHWTKSKQGFLCGVWNVKPVERMILQTEAVSALSSADNIFVETVESFDLELDFFGGGVCEFPLSGAALHGRWVDGSGGRVFNCTSGGSTNHVEPT